MQTHTHTPPRELRQDGPTIGDGIRTWSSLNLTVFFPPDFFFPLPFPFFFPCGRGNYAGVRYTQFRAGAARHRRVHTPQQTAPFQADLCFCFGCHPNICKTPTHTVHVIVMCTPNKYYTVRQISRGPRPERLLPRSGDRVSVKVRDVEKRLQPGCPRLGAFSWRSPCC